MIEAKKNLKESLSEDNSPFEEHVPLRREGQGDVKTSFDPKNKIIPYNPKLKELARQFRKNSTLAEILLWQKIKAKSLGYEFHRQVPVNEFIVDFYCHELQLVIEIDGNTHDYNYVNDENRQIKLESLGIYFVRFSDSDIKKGMNDVLRALEIVLSELEERKGIGKKEERNIPPTPLQRGT